MIPKIVHSIWIGPGEPSLLANHCMYEQRERFLHKADWEFTQWNEVMLKYHGLWDPFFDECVARKKWVHVTELARWLVLEKLGGIYLDCDVEPLRPFGPLLMNRFFAGQEGADPYVVNGAVVGAVPGHRLVRRIIEEFPRDPSGFPSDLGPVHLTRMLAHHGAEDCNVYPVPFFYAVPWQEARRADWARRIPPEAYAVHYYEGSWM